MTLLMRDRENVEKGRSEGKFISLDNLLERFPEMNVSEGAEILKLTKEELKEYKRTRHLN